MSAVGFSRLNCTSRRRKSRPLWRNKTEPFNASAPKSSGLFARCSKRGPTATLWSRPDSRSQHGRQRTLQRRPVTCGRLVRCRNTRSALWTALTLTMVGELEPEGPDNNNNNNKNSISAAPRHPKPPPPRASTSRRAKCVPE